MNLRPKFFSSLNYRSILVGFVMCVSILAFLFTGFGKLSFFNFSSMNPNTALIVGSQTVDMAEFANIMTSQGLSNSLPENQKKMLALQVLNQLIDQKLLISEAQSMGLEASQDDVVTFIRSIKVFYDPATNQFSLDQMRRYLASQQMNEIEFYRKIQDELTVQNISQLISLPVVYPTMLAKLNYEVENTEFSLQYALLEINPKTVEKQMLEKMNDFLKNPENEKQLRDLYNAQKSAYTQKTQYEVRSILVAYKDAMRAQGDALTRDKAQAQELSENILKKLQQKKKFSDLSGKLNDDAQAKQNGGNLGYVDDTSIDPVSYQAIAKLSEANSFSPVVDTPYGFRIFQLVNVKEGFDKSFEDVKLKLAEEFVMKDLKKSLQGEFENTLRAALVPSANLPVDASKLDALLTAQGIVWQNIEKPFSIKNDFIAELGSSKPLAESVFRLKKSGDILPQILNFDNSKRVIIKLVSLRKADAPSSSDLETTQKQMSNEHAQELYRAVLGNLRESYEKKGKIKMNPALVP